jgi:hypothetical protein
VLITGVGVEKLGLSENRVENGDQKCIRGTRKSFIGHPDATHFRQKFAEGVFQQLQLFPTLIWNTSDKFGVCWSFKA